ncbi:hypothetical protein [Thermus antranikianii]
MELERYLIDYYTRRLEEGGCCGSQGLGCGDLLQHVDLAPGLAVLDLGSGPGHETLAAAKAVGPTGRAIGVDLTQPWWPMPGPKQQPREYTGRNSTWARWKPYLFLTSAWTG